MNYILVNKRTKKTNRDDTLSSMLALVPEEKEILIANDTDYEELSAKLTDEDALYLAGGDGTLNYFFNQLDPDSIKNDIYFYSMGSGNDFFRDLGLRKTFVKMNDYLKNLPTINGGTFEKRFFLGAGLGMDGATAHYSETDEQRKNKNFVLGAIKAFFNYKPYNATVTIDGQSHHFEGIYLASVMKGSCVGGGMMIAPYQNRTDPDGKLTLVVVHSKNPVTALFSLLKVLFNKGKRTEKHFFECRGYEFSVEADRDNYLFFDGEDCPLGNKYTVSAKVPVSAK